MGKVLEVFAERVNSRRAEAFVQLESRSRDVSHEKYASTVPLAPFSADIL